MIQTPAGTPPKAPDERPKADRRALRGRLVLREGPVEGDRATPRTMLAAVLVHVVVIVVLVRLVTLGHGLHDWFGLKQLTETPMERVTYVEAPKPKPEPEVKPKPQPKPVEATVPVTEPVVATAPPTSGAEVTVDPALIAAARGGGGGSDSSGTGGPPRGGGLHPALIGIVPAPGDPRVWEPGLRGIDVPRSQQQQLDSILGWAIASAADSIDSIARLYNPNSKPAEWVKRMKNGEKWGWDNKGLRLGKIVIPNALLALLPASVQQGMQGNPIEARNSRAILLAREDINRFSAQAMGEGDFRKALKEIRARKDREYQARAKARAAEDKKQQAPPKAAGSGSDR